MTGGMKGGEVIGGMMMGMSNGSGGQSTNKR